MKKTLYLKFLLAYVIFGAFGFIIITTFIPGLTKEHLLRERADNLYTESMYIASHYATGLYSNEPKLAEINEQLTNLSEYLDSTIQIINQNGQIIIDTRYPLNSSKDSAKIQGFKPNFKNGNYYDVGTFYDSFDYSVLSVMAPITADFTTKGHVVIHCSLEKISESSDKLLNIFYITLFVLIFLSLMILIFFTEVVYIPLRKITHASEQFASGNMHYEIQLDSNDEMGYLAACLNYMANEIARSEDNQKKFIANCSHDFRSPLTSIRGYLEAMLDGTIPPEMNEKYLTIVLNETDRLKKLTDSLLTLNNLNTKGIKLDLSVFDLNRVIKNTAATFEGTCRGKNISIDLVLTGETMYVEADMGKIQQVLYNLTDNAIKFSNPNSVIKLETTLKKNKVFVSVKDSGIGIPKDDLKLIFDRFYKSDLSRGKDKKGTGLGLSIVKEIIQTHDENINVISTPGEGTEFIFTLPVSDKHDEEED